jgi:endonuclease/exonuclease/phosphatase family metal-dependent hydrolase
MGEWDARLAAIRAQLRELSPDVIGLQEVLRFEGFDQAELVAEGMGYHIAYGRHPEAVHPMGNAILSRFPIVRSEAMPLPHGGTDERRSVLFAELDTPSGRFPIFNTHLNWKLDEGHVRELQVRFITDAIAERAPMGTTAFPTVLMGDLNAAPDSDEIRFLGGLTSLGGRRVYFADCFGLVGAGDGATFSRRNPYAAALREPNRRIDYVFVRGPDDHGRGEPLAASVCFDSAHDGTFPTDHFGVVATLAT